MSSALNINTRLDRLNYPQQDIVRHDPMASGPSDRKHSAISRTTRWTLRRGSKSEISGQSCSALLGLHSFIEWLAHRVDLSIVRKS